MRRVLGSETSFREHGRYGRSRCMATVGAGSHPGPVLFGSDGDVVLGRLGRGVGVSSVHLSLSTEAPNGAPLCWV
jgi:hypothetical protein